MQESGHQELAMDLASSGSSNTISTFPIKKRLFHLSQCSPSSASKDPALPPQDVRSSKKSLISSPVFSASHIGDSLALGAKVENSTFDSTHGQVSVQEDNIEESTVHGALPSLGIMTEFASTDKYLCDHPIVTSDQQQSSLDNKKFQATVKQEKIENSFAHPTVSKAKWDLNIPMDIWDANCGMQRDSHVNKIQEKLKYLPVIRSSLVDGSSLVSKMSVLQGGHLKLANLMSSSAEPKDADIGLDLQLKPPSRPHVHINWDGTAPPDLSLSLTGNSSDASYGKKSKEHKNESRKEMNHPLIDQSISVGSSRNIKSEPSGENFEHQLTKVGGDRESNVVSAIAMESERHEEMSQGFINKLRRKSLNKDLVKDISISICADGNPFGDESIDLNSNPDENLFHDYSSIISTGSSLKVGEHTDMIVDTNAIPVSSKVYEAEKEASKNKFAQNVGDIINTLNDSEDVNNNSPDEGLLVSGPKESHLSDSRACGPFGEASDIVDKSEVTPTKEPLPPCGLSEGNAEMGCSDGEDSNALPTGSVNDLEMPSSVKSSEAQRRKGSVEVTEKIKEKFQVGDVRHDMPRAESEVGNVGERRVHDTDLKKLSALTHNDCDIEGKKCQVADGRHNVQHTSSEVENDGEKQVRDKNLNDFSSLADNNCDIGDKLIPVLEQSTSAQIAENCNGNLCTNKNSKGTGSTAKVPESLSMRVLRASSSGNSLLKLSQGETKDPPGKDNSLAANMKSTNDPFGKGVFKTAKSDLSSQHMNTKDSDTSMNNQVMSGSQLGSIVVKINLEDRSKIAQSNKPSLAPMKLFQKTKHIPGQSTLSHRRGQLMSSQGNRDERFRNITEKQDNTVGRHDLTNNRRDTNHQGVYKNRDVDPCYALEHNSSKYSRFRRPYNRPHVPFHAGQGRTNRRLGDNNSLHRFSSRRWHPRTRGVLPPVSDHAGGREPLQEMMGGLADEMIDPSLYPNQQLLFEQADGMLPRERRSLSPMQTRIPPGHVPRMRSPPMYISRGNAPNILPNGPPEVMRRRSPPAIRHNMRSPPRHPSFSEDVISRRHGSPYSRLPGEISEMRAQMEVELRGHGRFPQRHVRRFEMIDRQEDLDEYVEPLHFAQSPENQFGDDSREFDESHDFPEPYGQHHVVNNDEEQHLHYTGIDDVPGPIRYYPEGEMIVDDRESLRVFGGCMRTRGANLANRVRNMRANERFRNAPRQRDGDFGDARPKRRRY